MNPHTIHRLLLCHLAARYRTAVIHVSWSRRLLLPLEAMCAAKLAGLTDLKIAQVDLFGSTVVHEERLELSRLAAPEPKSGASAIPPLVLVISWGIPWGIPSCFIQLGDGFVERLQLSEVELLDGAGLSTSATPRSSAHGDRIASVLFSSIWTDRFVELGGVGSGAKPDKIATSPVLALQRFGWLYGSSRPTQ